MELLCGDIGGTKTLLQRVILDGDRIEVLDEQRYSSAAYADFIPMLGEFLARVDDVGTIAAACFGVAGPVVSQAAYQTAAVTNLPWHLDTRRLTAETALQRVMLINDFEAVALGIDALPAADFITVQGGEPELHGNRLVVGAGTGLGVAQMVWDGVAYRVLPGEGGHADFAPATPAQLEVSQWLMQQHGRCAAEFVVSGPGLVNLFRCLTALDGAGSAEQHHIMSATDPAAAIAAAAADAPDSLAGRAVDLFVEAYGALTGNLALTCLPLGGVYIAGGIAAKMVERLTDGRFIQAFNAKGKMASLMQRMPVKVVTNQAVGLIGSRVQAAKLANL